MTRELELERRLRIVETQEGQGESFDFQSWVWLVVLGVALPAALIAWGWL
jgi:hypothetical protein